MEKCRAFVLAGGGARGAMQVGALRALFEAGYQPDLLVGSSVGAINAACLALWGANLDGVARLERAYQEIAAAHFMDQRIGLLALRALSWHPNLPASQRVKAYFIQAGLKPDLCFGEIQNVRLGLVCANLGCGETMIYGVDPGQSVLEGLLATMALPPWFAPVEKDGRLMIDAFLVSNLPIEPAMRMGATEIIALDLNDEPSLAGDGQGLLQYLEKLSYAVIKRETELEIALAGARSVPVLSLQLRSRPPVPTWDFGAYPALFRTGYEITWREISTWKQAEERLAQP